MKLPLHLLIAGLWLGAAGAAAAQTGGVFDLSRSAVAAGGGQSAGGGFALNGAVATANSGHSAGGAFSLDGWWLGSDPTVDVPGELPQLPTTFAFLPARPNPFAHSIALGFDLPRGEAVSLAAFDSRGRRVRQLVSETLAPGTHHVVWDGSGEDGGRLPSGIYFVKLDAGEFHASSRIVLIH